MMSEKMNKDQQISETEKQKLNDDGMKETSRKVSELEIEVAKNVKRAVDKELFVCCLFDINCALGQIFEEMERRLVRIFKEANIALKYEGCDEVDGDDDVEGRLRHVIGPHFNILKEHIIMGLLTISEGVKDLY